MHEHRGEFFSRDNGQAVKLRGGTDAHSQAIRNHALVFDDSLCSRNTCVTSPRAERTHLPRVRAAQDPVCVIRGSGEAGQVDVGRTPALALETPAFGAPGPLQREPPPTPTRNDLMPNVTADARGGLRSAVSVPPGRAVPWPAWAA